MPIQKRPGFTCLVDNKNIFDDDCDINHLKMNSSKCLVGKGTDTVMDENIRKSKRVDHEKISLNTVDFNRWFEFNVMPDIKSEFPFASKIEAQFHDIVIYEQSDFFEKHKDAKKFDNHVGTLVINVKSNPGCYLICEEQEWHGGMPYDWCFFTLDDEHSVTKCEEGKSRVVIVFNIKAIGLSVSKKDEKINCKFDPEFSKVIMEKNKELLRLRHFCEAGKPVESYVIPFVGVILNKEYSPESDNTFTLAAIKDLNDQTLVSNLLLKYADEIKRYGLVDINLFSEFHRAGEHYMNDSCTCGTLKVVYDTNHKRLECIKSRDDDICECDYCMYSKTRTKICDCYYTHQRLTNNEFPSIETDDYTENKVELMFPLVCKWENYSELHDYLSEDLNSRGDVIETDIWGNQGYFDIYRSKRIAFIIQIEQS